MGKLTTSRKTGWLSSRMRTWTWGKKRMEKTKRYSWNERLYTFVCFFHPCFFVKSPLCGKGLLSLSCLILIPCHLFSVHLPESEVYPNSLKESPCSQIGNQSWRRITHLFWHTENFSTIATFHVWKPKWQLKIKVNRKECKERKRV